MSVVDGNNVVVGNSATPDNNFKFLIDDLGGMTLKSGGGTNTVLDITSAGAIKGVKFPATQVPSADVNTLDDYEEGTWGAVLTSGTGAITSYTVNSAKYTKIGRVVHGVFDITITNIGTAGTDLSLTLPAVTTTPVFGSAREVVATGFIYSMEASAGTNVLLKKYDNTFLGATNHRMVGGFTYFV